MEEHVAYSSPDWDGVLEEGVIVDEGTQGWCITMLGESVIHPHEPVCIWSIQMPEAKVCMRFVDNVRNGVINLN